MHLPRNFALFLLPVVWRALIGFLIIPLTTNRLEPADFGLFALVAAFVGIATAVSSLGSSQLLSAHLPIIDREDAEGLVSTLFISSLLIASLFSAGSFLIWPILMQKFPEFGTAPSELKWIIAITISFSAPWSLAAAVATITGGAKSFATITILEASTASGATLAALYALDLGALSLYIGLAAGAAVSAASSVIFLRTFFSVRVRKKWLVESTRVSAISLAGILAERAQVVFERYALSAHVGLSVVGLYSHGQQYQGLARMGMKAWLNALWPLALEEGRQTQPTFHRFLSVFLVSQLFLGLVGVAMATLGQDAIRLLTHDKFTSSHLLASFLLIIVQVEYMARPALVFLAANGRYIDLQKPLVISLVIAMLLIFPMTAFFGLFGALVTAFIQSVVYRFLLASAAKRLVLLPFVDHMAVVGIFATSASILLTTYAADGFAQRAAVWIGMSTFLAAVFFILRSWKGY